MSGPTAFLTGGSGLLGRHVASGLVDAGFTVVAPSHARVDVREADAVDAAIAAARPSLVVHLAAQAIVGTGRSDAALTAAVNVDGTRNVARATLMHARPGAALLFASTGRVYGDPEGLLHDERTAPAPRDPYAAGKLAAERSVAEAGAQGLTTVTIRSANLYGPGDRQPSRLVPELVAAACERRPARIDGDGSQRRDLGYAPDVAALYVRCARALTAPTGPPAQLSGATLNAGTGIATAVGQVQAIVAALATGKRVETAAPFAPGPASDRAHALLGWRPTTSLRDGLAATLAAARDVPPATAGGRLASERR